MRTALLCFILALPSCATQEQYAAQMANYISENYAETCTKLGYTAGTDNHRNCMVSMYNADQLRYSATPWYRYRRF